MPEVDYAILSEWYNWIQENEDMHIDLIGGYTQFVFVGFVLIWGYVPPFFRDVYSHSLVHFRQHTSCHFTCIFTHLKNINQLEHAVNSIIYIGKLICVCNNEY